MSLRTVLACLVVSATALFVVGVAIERSSEEDHHGPLVETSAGHAENGEQSTHDESGAESEAAHRGEREREAEAATPAEESHEELRPLGIDVEAWPFVTAAALVSLALAAAAWLLSGDTLVVSFVEVAMLAFAALDVREVVHQFDIDENGLGVLAGAVAALHLAAGVVAAAMASRAREVHGGSAGRPGTIPA
jgi:hypothetical protein